MNRMTADIPDLHRNLQRLVQAALGEGLKSLFNDVEKRLINRTEHTIDDASRQEFFDAVASLKQNRQQFRKNLLETLEQPDLPKKVPGNWSSLLGDHNLALIVEDIIGQAKARFGIEHAQYEARVAWMNQNDPDNMPAGLYTIPNITTAVILNLDTFPASARQGIIRALGNHLLNKLEPLYVLLNDFLIQAGVLTRVRSVRPPSGSAGDQQPDSAIQEVLAALDVVEPTILSGAELHDAIFKMTGKGARPAIVDGIDDWSPERLLDAIMGYLRRNGENTRIDAEEVESIKLVGLLFSTIMNDQKIRLSARQKILSLQWPVISAALRERGFFRHASHPARDVPNLCALIGSDPNASKEALVELGRIIDRIVLNHENDPKSFEHAREELKHIEKAKPPAVHDDQSQQPEQTPSHAEMLQRCQKRVSETINDRVAEHALTGKRILPETRDFVKEIIGPAMVVALINYGRNSQPWQKAIDMLGQALSLQSEVDLNPDIVTGFNKTTWDLLELVDLATPQMQGHLDDFVVTLGQQVANQETLRSSRRTYETESAPADVEESATQTEDATTAEAAAIEVTPTATDQPVTQSAGTTSDTADEPEARPSMTPAETVAAEPAPIDSPVEPLEAPTAVEPEPETHDEIEVEADAEIQETTAGPTEEERQTEQAVRLLTHDGVMGFIDTHLMNNEWFQVYTGPGNALRRLKGKDINPALGVVNFANRTGELELFVPLPQLVQDLLQGRTRPVFENPTYNRALNDLQRQLDSEAARDEDE